MRKKVVSNLTEWIAALLIPVGFSLLFYALRDSLSYAAHVMTIILVALSFIAVLISWNMYYVRSILTKETITFKHKLTGKNRIVQVGTINRFVVDLNKSKSEDIRATFLVFANNPYGKILGAGNGALKALMKYYPHIPVVIKFFDYTSLFRSTAKYIVKNQRTSKAMCKRLCKYYHISTKLLHEDKCFKNENDAE